MKYPITNIFKHYIGTTQHKFWVAFFICGFIIKLIKRALKHDLSKYSMEESRGFFRVIGKLQKSTYGSPGYKETLEMIQPSIQAHYKKNSHHPEHTDKGFAGFDLADLVETFMDWKAAVRRHNDGNISRSIEINRKRFNIDGQICEILKNSA